MQKNQKTLILNYITKALIDNLYCCSHLNIFVRYLDLPLMTFFYQKDLQKTVS